jgi:hypothetical protein
MEKEESGIYAEGAENWLYYYSRSQKASVAFTIIVGWMDSVVFPFGNEK